MENNIWDDDVHKIFNNVQRQNAIIKNYVKRKRKRNTKKLIDSGVFSVFAIMFALFGWLGWIIQWLAFSVGIVCGLWSAFCFGRWFENVKYWGWK